MHVPRDRLDEALAALQSSEKDRSDHVREREELRATWESDLRLRDVETSQLKDQVSTLFLLLKKTFSSIHFPLVFIS